MSLIRCVACGRVLLGPSILIPPDPDSPTPHPGGAVGPVCARNLGLNVTRKRVAAGPARQPKG